MLTTTSDSRVENPKNNKLNYIVGFDVHFCFFFISVGYLGLRISLRLFNDFTKKIIFMLKKGTDLNFHNVLCTGPCFY